MDNVIGFAGVAGAIVASMGLAMWLEWNCLRWLMRLMPGHAAVQSQTPADLDAAAPNPAETDTVRRAA